MSARTVRRQGRIAAVLVLAATCWVAIVVAGRGTAARADAPNSCSTARTDTSVGEWHTSRIDTSSDLDWYRFSVTASRHALVTLGALSSNLSLALYDSSCHLLATSNRGGTAYEQIYRGLSRGHYFARVSGVSGATGSYSLQFRVLAEGFVVLSSRGSVQQGRITVVGDLLNNISTSRDFPDVAAVFYDAHDRVVTASRCPVDAVVIAARHRAPVECDALVPPTYHHYRILAVQSDQPGEVMHGLTLTHDPTTVLPDGTRTYTGSLHNGNAFRITEVQIAVLLRDDRGRVVTVTSTWLRDVAAHGSVRWQLQTGPVAGAQQVSFYPDARRVGAPA